MARTIINVTTGESKITTLNTGANHSFDVGWHSDNRTLFLQTSREIAFWDTQAKDKAPDEVENLPLEAGLFLWHIFVNQHYGYIHEHFGEGEIPLCKECQPHLIEIYQRIPATIQTRINAYLKFHAHCAEHKSVWQRMASLFV